MPKKIHRGRKVEKSRSLLNLVPCHEFGTLSRDDLHTIGSRDVKAHYNSQQKSRVRLESESGCDGTELRLPRLISRGTAKEKLDDPVN